MIFSKKPKPNFHCPTCNGALQEESSLCINCGFNIQLSDEKFGTSEVVLARIMDSEHCLNATEKRNLNRLLDQFQDRFPQLFFLFYIDSIPHDVDLMELNFWLLNRAATKQTPETISNENAILFTIDLENYRSCLSTGYYVERILKPKTIGKTLQKIKPDLLDRNYFKATTTCISLLDIHLRKQSVRLAKLAKKNPTDFNGSLPASLKPLRKPKKLNEKNTH